MFRTSNFTPVFDVVTMVPETDVPLGPQVMVRVDGAVLINAAPGEVIVGTGWLTCLAEQPKRVSTTSDATAMRMI